MSGEGHDRARSFEVGAGTDREPTRLLDAQPSKDPTVAKGVQLLRAAPPYDPPPLLEQRVRRALDEPRGRRVRLRGLRPAAVVAALVATAATASAMYGVVRVVSAPAEADPMPSASPVLPRASAALDLATPGAPAPVLEEAPDEGVAEPVASAAAPTRSAPQPPPARGSAAAADEAALVAGAMKALRQQGDPAQAGRLLEEYRRSHPDGALAEEALALSMEAAAARNDPRATDLARRYLARYPNGRFRAAARRVVARADPRSPTQR